MNSPAGIFTEEVQSVFVVVAIAEMDFASLKMMQLDVSQ